MFVNIFVGGFTVCLSTCLMVALSAVFVSVSIGFFLYVFFSLWWLGLLCVCQCVCWQAPFAFNTAFVG